MPIQVWIDKAAIKQGRKVPVEILMRLVEAVGRYAENRNAAIDIKALQGARHTFRIRSGDWRLVFEVEGDRIRIVRIAPRGSIY